MDTNTPRKMSFLGGQVHPAPSIFDPSCAYSYGMALAQVLRPMGITAFAVADDGRLSGGVLRCALMCGLLAGGADVADCGISAAPALSVYCGGHSLGGVMITAPRDGASLNGIKVFSRDGSLLPSETAARAEELAFSGQLSPAAEPGRLKAASSAHSYADMLKRAGEVFCTELKGLTIAIDCANGGASGMIRGLFAASGAKVYLLGCEPDGKNICEGCGVSSPAALTEFVRSRGCDAGFALSADASSVICFDSSGTACPGEKLFAFFLDEMREKGLPYRDTAVVTGGVGSALTDFARRKGITLVTADRSEDSITGIMKSAGAFAGCAEGISGGIYFNIEGLPRTSDGLLQIMLVCGLMTSGKKSLSELSAALESRPRVELSVGIPENKSEIWKNIPLIEESIDKYSEELGPSGMVTVAEERTGMIRVTVEGGDFSRINAIASELSELIQKTVR